MFVLVFWIPAFAGMTTFFVLPFFHPSIARAVGISVSPPTLELKNAANKKITGTFTVMNPSRESVVYEITNDGLLPLVITPITFLLEPGKRANIAIEYPPNKLTTANYRLTTQLSILGRPLTVQPTQAASGIKLPVSISVGQVEGVSTRRYDPIAVGILLIDMLLLGLFVYLVIKRHFKVLPLARGR